MVQVLSTPWRLDFLSCEELVGSVVRDITKCLSSWHTVSNQAHREPPGTHLKSYLNSILLFLLSVTSLDPSLYVFHNH